MAQQTIGIGAVANDGTGDPIRDAFDKCNDNFTELYTGLVGLLDFKGATDCSANPNYPAASKGDFYVVSVAGKIGGASGTVVEVGDAYFATADNAGGTQASVGTSWSVIQGNIVGGTITELDDIPDVNAPSPSDGDALVWDSGANEWVPVPLPGGGAGGTVPDGGADRQVLTKQSAVDQDVDWESLPAGAWKLIETLSPSAASSIDTTDFDGLGYKDVMVVLDLIVSVDATDLSVQFKLNGGFKNSSYFYSAFGMSSSGTSGAAASSTTGTGLLISGTGATWGIGNAAGESYNVEFSVLAIDSAHKKRVKAAGNYHTPSGQNNAFFSGGLYNGTDNASPLEAFRFAPASGTITGTIRIYAR